MPKSLLDTDMFSEILKGVDPVVAQRATAYRTAFGHYTISAIAVLEIVKGLHKVRREERIQQFLQGLAQVEVLALDVRSGELAGRISADLEEWATDWARRPDGCCDCASARADACHRQYHALRAGKGARLCTGYRELADLIAAPDGHSPKIHLHYGSSRRASTAAPWLLGAGFRYGTSERGKSQVEIHSWIVREEYSR
jgi:predicted nucleic acid-binding protein